MIRKKNKNEGYCTEDLKSYIALPLRQKLQWLENMNHFLDRLMPPKNKKIWQRLKEKGF